MEVAECHSCVVQLGCCCCVSLVHGLSAKQWATLGQVGVDLGQLSKEGILLGSHLVTLVGGEGEEGGGGGRAGREGSGVGWRADGRRRQSQV